MAPIVGFVLAALLLFRDHRSIIDDSIPPVVISRAVTRV